MNFLIMAQFDSLIIFSLVWSVLLILILYYKLSLESLIPHFSGLSKFVEKKLILLNNFQNANATFMFNKNNMNISNLVF
jgi:hypothetical protein